VRALRGGGGVTPDAPRRRDWPRTGLAVAAVLFVVDQLLKWLVTGPLGIGYLGAVRTIAPVFDLRFVPNVGVSLGLLRADSEVTRWALVGLTGAIALGVAVWLWRERNAADKMALGCVLGGAIGNIVDRIRLGYVIDYADLHFGEWRPFLVFNLADAAITIGVLILLARALLVRDKPAPSTPESISETTHA
jgi:signal peptidase II